MIGSIFAKKFAGLFALALIATMVVQAQSSDGRRITQPIDERNLVTLKGHVIPLVNANTDRGQVADSLNIDHIHLVLQRSPEQEQELNQLIEDQNDRTSPNFHHWLTAADFGERFGVAQEDIDTVSSWLTSHGFTVNKVYTNKMLIDFSGSAGQVREAFHTPIHNLAINGEQHIANVTNPQIPAALAPVIKGIASLNNIKPKAMHEPIAPYTFAGCAPSADHPTSPGTCYAITPQDNQTIYNLNPLYAAGISGQGQTIYLAEDTDTYGTAGTSGKSDWNTYRSVFGLTANFPLGSYNQIHPGGCTDPGTNGDDGEAAIDVEVASAIAPSAAIVLISCPSASSDVTFGGQIAVQNLINESSPTLGVISVSYGLCEAVTGQGGNAAFYNTYQQAASEGFSVFVSSGDEGPSSCSNLFGEGYDVASLGVTGWGETPFNVTVGGTDFEDTYNSKEGGPALSTYWNATNSTYYGSAKSYIPEIPWNDACADPLISEVANDTFTTYGTSGTCNKSPYDTTSGYLIAGGGSGGASNCAIGAGGTDQSSDAETLPNCQGYPKPSWQSGTSLPGGVAVYGVPNDGVRDIPDVSMFAANGLWGHYEVVCWSDPSQTSGGATSCAGAPSTWAGFGGTSVASPTMAAVQALVNQRTGQFWGNPNPTYYQIAQGEYGTAGGSFLGGSCNSSGAGGPASGCVFNDVTEGDITEACEYNSTLSESHCYKPSGTYGVDSTDNVTAATVIDGGSGYTTAPSCAIAGPSNASLFKSPTYPGPSTILWAGGTQATCTAAVNSGTTNAAWTIKIAAAPGTDWVSGVSGFTIGGTTYTFVSSLSGAPANSVLYVASGSASTQETDAAKNLEAAVNLNSAQCVTAPCYNVTAANAYATATESTSTVTLTAKTAGYAGNFNVAWANGFVLGADYVTITNTTKGQGPNYVSGITVGTGANAGSGYAPDTPITLTGGGGSGAIAVANTSLSTGAQSYQPAYGAAPGYDLATGLGTPNAYNLVCASIWGKLSQSITWGQQGPYNYGQSPVSLTATGGASGDPVTFSYVSGPGSLSGPNNSTLTITGAGTIVINANQAGNCSYAAATQVQQSIVVNQLPQTITGFTPSSPVTYGVTPITLSATGGASGNPVTFSILSGGSYGSLSGPNNSILTITGAGTIQLAANQAGNSDYEAATQVTANIVVHPAVLTVTANNANMPVGGPLPTFTASYSGFQYSDGVGVLSGAPSFSTTATTSSNTGTYPITVTQGTLSAANYTFTFVNGTLSVVSGPTVIISTTSAAVTGSNAGGYSVTFTVTNNGTGTASNVTLTSATLGGATGSPLPQSVATLAAGASTNFTVSFPGSAGLDGAGVSEKYAGTYTGGTFSASLRSVTLP